MEILDLLQGSDEWLEARLNYCCASEASAVMRASKFMSRNQLLDLKKGWQKNPDSSFKQKLFEKAHVSEDSAREITQLEHCEDFPPVVGLRKIQDGDYGYHEFLASFDGLEGGAQQSLPWEHKEWNEQLAENVRNGVLEPHYYWQLEHQALVADYPRVLFTCSDGNEDKRVSMFYHSVPERRAELIAGWKQFLLDLEDHEIEAKQELIVAREVESLPVITFKVEGSLIVSNIQDCLPIIKDRAAEEMSRVLETEQDFIDKDAFNKATKAARVKLKDIIASVQGEFVSYSEFAGVAADIDVVLQKMQSAGEKQVKLQKEAKKKAIMVAGNDLLVDYIIGCSEKLKDRITLSGIVNTLPNFVEAMKNKRTIESWQSAVDDEVARVKVDINEVMELALPNLEFLDENQGEYGFLFTDIQNIVYQYPEPFEAVVKSRIADHKAAEEKRLAADRERIREEEKAKAEKEVADKKLADDAAAKKEADARAAEEQAEQDQQAAHDKKAAEYNAEQAELSVDSKDYTPPKAVDPAAKTMLEPVESEEPAPRKASPGFLNELNQWLDAYNIPLSGRGSLEEILRLHNNFFNSM